MTNWQEELNDVMETEIPKMDDVYEDTYSTKEKEIGIVHPTKGTGMILRKSGIIDTFADYNLGVKMDPSNHSLSVYASTIKIHADNVIRVDYEDTTYFTNEMAEIKQYVE